MALIKLNNQSLTAVSALPAGVGGKVLQVLTTTSTGTTNPSSTNNNYMDIAGMSLTITPKLANSNFLITYTNHIYVQDVSGQTWSGVGVRLLRDSTVIQTPTAASYGTSHNLYNSSRMMVYETDSFVDTPNTTNAITYHLEAASLQGGVDHTLNESGYGTGGKFHIMEIAA